MPVWGRRGGYTAVTYTAVALVGIGVFAQCTRGLILPPEQNELAPHRARFLARAARQSIEWRTTDSSPFAEAKRLDRPVMVFAGTSASSSARRFDDLIFANREVAARLNRDFVCVRVDTNQEPEWRSAFISVFRGQLQAENGFAVWFFDPDGTLLTWIGRREWGDTPEYNDFLSRVSDVTELRRTAQPGEWSQGEREQNLERQRFRAGGSVAVPDLDAFVASLTVPRNFREWQAGRYRVLVQSGQYAALNSLLSSELAWMRTDLVDGGFFRLASGVDPALVEYDKTATVNADMLAVLARASVATHEPIFRYWYERTLDCLSEQFMSGKAWSSFVEVVADEDGRSPRHSFGAGAYRKQFDSELRGFASELGLSSRTNPLMVPFLADPGIVVSQRESLDKAVESLRSIGDASVVTLSADDSLDSAGFVVARTFEAAHILGDERGMELARGWLERLDAFRAGTDDVRHSTVGRGMGRKWLGDYTSYADAMLEAYGVTGEERYLDSGEAVLRRALEVFTRSAPGDIVCVSNPTATGGPSLEMPSLVDDGSPPALAWLMSLCFRYGAVLGDPSLRQRAVDIAERFSSVANADPALFPTFFAAAQEVMSAGCVIVPRGDTEALSWYSSRPDLRAFMAAASNQEAGARATVRYTKAGYAPLSR